MLVITSTILNTVMILKRVSVGKKILNLERRFYQIAELTSYVTTDT